MQCNGEWTPVRLGDIVKIKHGWPFKSEFFSEELTGRPIVVAVGNFRYTGGFRFDSTTVKEYRADYPRDYELTPGDTLLVMTCQTAGGEILGIPARVPDDGRTYLHNQRLGKVVIERPDCVDEDFLYWVFLWSEFNQELFATSSGTKIVHTAPSRIEAFRFELPPLQEQRAIARILGALDDKIELNRQMNATLEGMARALFKSWFVDFDPVTAKAAGRQPFGMSPDLAALFPDRFVDSPLGAIPEGWKAGCVGNIATNPRRSVDPKAIDPSTPYIGLEHIPRECMVLDAWGRADAVTSQKSSFERGEILFGKLRPYFHKVGVALCDGVCSTDVLVIAPKEEHWFGLLLGHASSADFVDHADATSSGTRQPRTNWRDLARYEVALPPQDVAEWFSRRCREYQSAFEANAAESQVLSKLRDALLPQLLSGEIRLRDAEKLVEEVA